MFKWNKDEALWLLGWGGRLEQQEAEEEQKYLMEQQRQTQVIKYTGFQKN